MEKKQKEQIKEFGDLNSAIPAFALKGVNIIPFALKGVNIIAFALKGVNIIVFALKGVNITAFALKGVNIPRMRFRKVEQLLGQEPDITVSKILKYCQCWYPY